LRTQQIAERLGVEEAHMLEFRDFNCTWDQRMSEYERNAEDLFRQTQEKHREELIEFQKGLIAQSNKPKFSRDLLNLRRIQENFAKQKK
jgi:hypothetical protein